MIFTADDFHAIKMPRKMSNGQITVDCLRLDETVQFANARLRPLAEALEALLAADTEAPDFASIEAEVFAVIEQWKKLRPSGHSRS